MPSTPGYSARYEKKNFVCVSRKTDLDTTLSGMAPDTHLQQKGPRSGLGPRRRCWSGAGKLQLTQTHGTLQNRHVRSQARESHWKKNKDVVQREDRQAATTIPQLRKSIQKDCFRASHNLYARITKQHQILPSIVEEISVQCEKRGARCCIWLETQ